MQQGLKGHLYWGYVSKSWYALKLASKNEKVNSMVVYINIFNDITLDTHTVTVILQQAISFLKTNLGIKDSRFFISLKMVQEKV